MSPKLKLVIFHIAIELLCLSNGLLWSKKKSNTPKRHTISDLPWLSVVIIERADKPLKTCYGSLIEQDIVVAVQEGCVTRGENAPSVKVKVGEKIMHIPSNQQRPVGDHLVLLKLPEPVSVEHLARLPQQISKEKARTGHTLHWGDIEAAEVTEGAKCTSKGTPNEKLTFNKAEMLCISDKGKKTLSGWRRAGSPFYKETNPGEFILHGVYIPFMREARFGAYAKLVTFGGNIISAIREMKGK